MTNTVLIKRSGTANSIPTAGQLQQGELAINYADGNLFYKNSSNVVTLLTSNQFVSVAGNITGGNLNATGLSLSGNVVSTFNVTGNINGGNLRTVGQISATGTISTTGSTVGTGFAVGNGAVSNVGLGFFPTAGTAGDYAIRDYSTVTNSIYLDVGMGGTAAGSFQFRTTNAYTQLAVINSSGINTSLAISATGNVTGGNINTAGSVYGNELYSTNSIAGEGGQINLALPSSGSTLNGGVIIDVYNNLLRFFERGGTNRGAYIDLTAASAGVGSNLLAGGSSTTPTQIVNGTSNVSVTSSGNITANVAGAWSASFYSSGMIANSFWANNNGTGQNFQVGDDAWIGDINLADTLRVMGQQNAANGYIVFGNADGTQLGRAGSGPLTYGGAFSATGNVNGGNILTSGLITAVGNIIGNRIAVAAGTAAAPSVQFSNDIAADTGFYWVSDGNIGVTTNGTLRATFSDTGLSLVGNVTSNNLNAAGLSLSSNVVSALNVTGNIAGGNILTPGIISATSNITGGNLNAAGLSLSSNVVSALNVTSNIAGGNILTPGLISSTGNITGGNLRTAGLISATGTITGSNIIMGVTGAYFSNGTLNVGTFNAGGGTVPNATTFTGSAVRISGTNYNSVSDSGTIALATQSWMTGFNVSTAQAPVTYTNLSTLYLAPPLTPSTNVTVTNSWALYSNGAIGTSGIISATGNITGNYFIGNGSQLTGIATGSSTKISNGTSEANIGTSGGNANITIGGVSNVAVFTTTGLNLTGNISASGNISSGIFYGGGNLGLDTEAVTQTFDFGNLTAAVDTIYALNVVTAPGDAVNGVNIIDYTIAGNKLANSIVLTAPNIGNATGTSVTVTGNVNAAGLTGTTASVTGTVFADRITTVSIPQVLNDISYQCDGAKMVFPLRVDQSNITSANITDSKNLQVAVSGRVLSPWINTQTWPWFQTFAGFPTTSPGYRVTADATSANITFYQSPAQGSQVVLTIINNSSTAQLRKYPYSATTIALGD